MFVLADYDELGYVPGPMSTLSLNKTSLKDTRSLDAGVFDIVYDIPLAGDETSMTGLTAFVFQVCLENITKYIVQVNRINP